MSGLLGTSPPERKQLSLLLRLSSLMCLEHDLTMIKSMNFHTFMTASTACSQLARAAGKYADRFSMSPDLVRHIVERVRSIQGRARSLRIAHDAIFVQNALVVTSTNEDSSIAQFSPLFGRLRRDTGLEHLVGKARVPPIVCVLPNLCEIINSSISLTHIKMFKLRKLECMTRMHTHSTGTSGGAHTRARFCEYIS